MNIRKRFIIAMVGAVLITIVGLLFVALGGWGSCGPASRLAVVGGLLSLDHCSILFSVISESFIAHIGIPDSVVILIVPIFNWFIILFVGFTLWTKLKRKSKDNP
jgi:hypothetical protein